MRTDLIYRIEAEELTKENLTKILKDHPEIKFISLGAVDLIGHETDTKIPVKGFLEDLDIFLYGYAAQTDGSSVFLPKIATLHNAKVDMKADLTVPWFIEYNMGLIDRDINKPVGTLKIPCYLYHDHLPVDSRHLLTRSIDYFKKSAMMMFKENPGLLREYNIKFEDLDEVELTSATELEFWVKSPSTHEDIEALSTSQELKEQYWSKTRGEVRSALEETLILMECYGIKPEMGHKEVGGVRPKLKDDGQFEGVLEQLEIDWKYASPKETGDQEIFVRNLVREVFIRHGLEVTFLAKPLENVAGSGEHTHISGTLRLKNGTRINLLHSMEEDFMTTLGYGALMGILKNYEIINPFVTSSNEAFKRLKKGYEAPITIVSSLGYEPKIPSRNRTILIGLLRDENNPMATRFELRSPNPHTNTYLCLASLLMSMVDGMDYAKDKERDSLLKELSKEKNEDYPYLEKGRVYRTEKDVYDDFTDEEREDLFGQVPENVYENSRAFDLYPDKVRVLSKGNVFTPKLIESYNEALLYKWYTEIHHRIIPSLMDEIRSLRKRHIDGEFIEDKLNCDKVMGLKIELMKSTSQGQGIFNQMRSALEKKDYESLSDLQKIMEKKMMDLRVAYKTYEDSLLDVY